MRGMGPHAAHNVPNRAIGFCSRQTYYIRLQTGKSFTPHGTIGDTARASPSSSAQRACGAEAMSQASYSSPELPPRHARRPSRREATPHARRSDTPGVSTASRQKNPTKYRTEAGSSASAAPTRSPARSAPSARAPSISSRTEGCRKTIGTASQHNGALSIGNQAVVRRISAREGQGIVRQNALSAYPLSDSVSPIFPNALATVPSHGTRSVAEG